MTLIAHLLIGFPQQSHLVPQSKELLIRLKQPLQSLNLLLLTLFRNRVQSLLQNPHPHSPPLTINLSKISLFHDHTMSNLKLLICFLQLLERHSQILDLLFQRTSHLFFQLRSAHLQLQSLLKVSYPFLRLSCITSIVHLSIFISCFLY